MLKFYDITHKYKYKIEVICNLNMYFKNTIKYLNYDYFRLFKYS